MASCPEGDKPYLMRPRRAAATPYENRIFAQNRLRVQLRKGASTAQLTIKNHSWQCAVPIMVTCWGLVFVTEKDAQGQLSDSGLGAPYLHRGP